jgi:hypothetical protein
MRGTVAQVKPQITDCARTAAITKLTLWEPGTKTLERIEVRA